MGKGDLGDFAELGVVVVARLAGLYIFAELLGFSHIGICRLYRECSKKRGNILFAAVLNALAIPEIRELYELLDGISNSNKHSLKPSYAEEHVWLHMLYFEADGLRQQKTMLGAVSKDQEIEATVSTD